MLFILKNSCSKFGSKARESLCDDINNYCKLILTCRFGESFRGVTLRHTLHKWLCKKQRGTSNTNNTLPTVFEHRMQWPTLSHSNCFEITVTSTQLCIPWSQQTVVYNCLSLVGVFIKIKKHILCIRLHKIFQVCGNM